MVEGIRLSGQSIAHRWAVGHGWARGISNENKVGMGTTLYEVVACYRGERCARFYCWMAYCANVLSD